MAAASHLIWGPVENVGHDTSSTSLLDASTSNSDERNPVFKTPTASSSETHVDQGDDYPEDGGASGQLDASQAHDANVDEGELPSNPGSAQHFDGKCKRCSFFGSKVGCTSGSECSFCHFPHPKVSKPRPCKDKRDRARRALTNIAEALRTDPDNLEDHCQRLPAFIRKNPARLKKTMQELRSYTDASKDGDEIQDSTGNHQVPPSNSASASHFKVSV